MPHFEHTGGFVLRKIPFAVYTKSVEYLPKIALSISQYEKLFRFVSKDAISFYTPLINTTPNVFPNNARLHATPHLAAALFILIIIKQLYGPVYEAFGFTSGGIEFRTFLLNVFRI